MHRLAGRSRAGGRSRPLIRSVLARPRFLAAGALFAGAMAFVPAAALTTRFLISWNAAAAAFVVLAWIMAVRSTTEDIQRRADEEDAGAFLVLGLSILAAVVSLAAIGGELHDVKVAGSTGQKAERLGLAVLTILVSWFFVHTIFAVHYAHEFYAGDGDRRGLAFPGEADPDYWDFLYFSFTIGAAAQTSDVSVPAARMRRVVLAHTIVAFLYNTTVLALAINVSASSL